jgi:hypothetical protein
MSIGVALFSHGRFGLNGFAIQEYLLYGIVVGADLTKLVPSPQFLNNREEIGRRWE